MGSKLCCIAQFFGASDDAHHTAERDVSLPFTLEDAVEPLLPDISLKIHQVVIPRLLFTSVSQFENFQLLIPSRYQGRKWKLLYGSDYHGFARVALEKSCAKAFHDSEMKVQDGHHPVIVFIQTRATATLRRNHLVNNDIDDSVNSEPGYGCILGAYLSHIPQWNRKRYYGTEESFVFTFTYNTHEESARPSAHDHYLSSSIRRVAHEKEVGNFLSPLLEDNRESTSLTKMHVYRVPSDADNRYVICTEGGAMAIGGGGKGPAILLDRDLARVSCSTRCPTFGIKQSLLFNFVTNSMFSDGGGAVEIARNGITLEGGEPSAEVASIQVWIVGDEYYDH